jgi:hypothetical protein
MLWQPCCWSSEEGDTGPSVDAASCCIETFRSCEVRESRPTSQQASCVFRTVLEKCHPLPEAEEDAAMGDARNLVDSSSGLCWNLSRILYEVTEHLRWGIISYLLSEKYSSSFHSAELPLSLAEKRSELSSFAVVIWRDSKRLIQSNAASRQGLSHVMRLTLC